MYNGCCLGQTKFYSCWLGDIEGNDVSVAGDIEGNDASMLEI